jgi:diguanylate cyclase (GGDEF)-like protein
VTKGTALTRETPAPKAKAEGKPRPRRAATPNPPRLKDSPAPRTVREIAREETPGWARGQTAQGAPPKPKLVRAVMAMRRAMRRASGPFLAGLFAAALIALEGKRVASGEGNGLLFAGVSLGFVARLASRVVSARRAWAQDDPAAPPIDLELAVLLVVGATGLASRLPGGLDGSAFGLVLVIGAIVATFAARIVAITAFLVALAIDAGVRGGIVDPLAARAVLQHGALLGAVVALNAVVLRGRIDSIGARARRRFDKEVERMREQARSYRLLDAPKADAPPKSMAEGHERVQRSGVEEIQIAVRFALDLLKRSLAAHTAVLLFESPSRERGKGVLKLAEVVTDAAAISEGPFGMGDGVLGAVARRRAAVNLHGLRAGYRVPYSPAPLAEGGVSSVVAAPILEEGVVRGVLCVDRLPGEGGDRPFSAHEEELVVAAARFVLRAIENERVFGRLERAKAEQDQLYAASQRLSGALTEAEVIEAGVESARAIAAFDLAAITVVHEVESTTRTERFHEVRAVAGAADFESLVGLRFGDNGGLVSQAVKSRCTLPHRGDHDPQTQVVFTRRHPLRVELEGDQDLGSALDLEEDTRTAEVRSILVVPLTLHDRSLGTLVLGARRRGAFRELSEGGGARRTLEVLASHIATSLANARMLAKLEELATTDGLTGLLNKRVLLELGQQKVRAAARYGKPLSVIQTDIDFFKKVNDTHGHDVGDQVIKGLAGILRRLKRSTDYVARFGGEEFVILCEETDSVGAVHLAERVREELLRTTFHAASGPFQVTCSLGVATHPADGTTWDDLYKATDEALYASKRAGRNRTTLAPGSTGTTNKKVG